MTTDNYTMRVLRADEGNFLTNNDAQTALDKVIATVVYLAVNDTPDRWIEIDAQQAEEIKALQAEEIKAQQAEEQAQQEMATEEQISFE